MVLVVSMEIPSEAAVMALLLVEGEVVGSVGSTTGVQAKIATREERMDSTVSESLGGDGMVCVVFFSPKYTFGGPTELGFIGKHLLICISSTFGSSDTQR